MHLSSILFVDFRKKHADIQELQRPDRYGQLDFTTDLIRQLADLDVHADVPLLSKKHVFTTHSIIPVMTMERKNCKKCYKEKQKEQKTNVWVVRLTCVSRVIETAQFS